MTSWAPKFDPQLRLPRRCDTHTMIDLNLAALPVHSPSQPPSQRPFNSTTARFWGQAVCRALGARLRNVVVRDRESALLVVRHFQQHKIGSHVSEHAFSQNVISH